MRKFLLTMTTVLLCAAALFGCEKHTHDYVKETVTEADCSKNGVITYTCACGDTYDEIVPPTDMHIWDDGVITAEASCITDGTTAYTCTVCKAAKEEPIAAPGAHNWGETIITKEATCAAEGESQKTCARCGAAETAVIEKLETHTWKDGEETKAATCAEAGILTYACGVCAAVKTEEIPVLEEHTWDDGTTTKASTCVEKGQLTYTCQICEKTKTEEIAVSDVHSWDKGQVKKAPTCSQEGEQEYSCTVCETVKVEKIAATALHQWDGGTVVQAASCAAYGSKAFKCVVCGAQRSESIPKTETHSWDNGKTVVKPTCSKAGETSYTCTLCRKRKKEAIPPTQIHTWEKSVSTEPTYTTEGVLTYSCKYCEESYTETIKKYNYRPDAYGDPHHIRNSNNPDNYLDFEISGDTVRISGKIVFEDLERLWFRCGDAKKENEYSKIIDMKSGEWFSVSLSLRHITEKTFVTVHTYRANGDGMFWSYSWKDAAIVPDGEGYRFVHSMVIDHNIEIMKHWVDPRDCLSANISEQLKELSDTIVGQETNEYKKLYLLNKWVAENIYYDYDYYYGRSKEVFYSADEVYQHKRSVCAGYARLLHALIQAQGIPCIEVGTFSAGVSTIGYFDESNYMTEKTNHAHVEAYLASEDRWIIMDPTWDSGNKYENGKFIDGTFAAKYFDMSLDFFSYSHKILKRPN